MELGSPLIANRYRLGAPIGQGASATVHQATDTWRQNAPVAVKVLHMQGAANGLELHLRREFAHLFVSNHPHLPRVHHCGLLPDKHALHDCPPRAFFLVQDLIIGQQAGQWAATASVEELAHLGAQICAALAFLHQRGIRHGDIKPENIVVGAKGMGKLVDFGLSCDQLVSNTDTISGTPRFLSPQALQGQPQLSCDLYALGITLYSMLTGSLPQGDWGLQLASKHFNGLLKGLTHPDALQRPSAAEAFELLESFAKSNRAYLNELREQSHHQATLPRDELKSLWKQHHPKGTTRWIISGPKGSGKTTAGEFLITRSILYGATCPDSIRPARDGSLSVLGQLAFELELKPPPPDASQWQIFANWASQLQALCENHPLAIIWDDVPDKSSLSEFGAFLQRLGAKGPNLIWVELSQSDSAASLTLSPLSEPEITALIHCSRPLRPLDARLAPTLAPLVAGNPRKLIRLLQELPGVQLLEANHKNLWPSHILKSDSDYTLPHSQSHFLSGLNYFHDPLLLADAQKLSLFSDNFETTIQALLDQSRIRICPSPDGPTLELMGIPPTQSLSPSDEATLFADLNKQDSYPKTRGHLALRLGHRTEGISALRQAIQNDKTNGNPGKALASLNKLLELDSLTPEEKRSLQSQAAAMASALGQFDQALTLYQESIDSPESQYGLGEVLLKLGRYKDASAQLLPLINKSQFDIPQIEVLLARANLFSGALDDAEEIATNALKKSTHPNRIKLLATLGLVHYFRGQLTLAQQYLEQSYNYGIEQHQTPLVVEELDATRGNLAMVLHKNNALQQAESLYRESLHLAKENNDLPKQVLRLTNLGTIVHQQEQYQEAMAIYKEALTLAELIKGDREFVRVVLNSANLSSFLGQTTEALKEVSVAVNLANANGMQTEHAYLNLLAAELALAESSPQQAKLAEETARSFFDGSNNQAGIAECYIIQTQIAVFNKQTTRAIATAERAVQIAEKIERPTILVNAYLWQALAAINGSSSEHFRIATTATNLILTQPSTTLDQTVLWMTHAIQGILFTQQADIPQAHAAFLNARQRAAKSLALFKGTYEESYISLWYRQPLWVAMGADSHEEFELFNRNVDKLLAINRELTRDHDPVRLLERIIDAAIALSGAERGFIILRQAETFEIQTARNMEQESLEGEHLQYSNSIAQQAIDSSAPVTSMDALGDERFSESTSVHHLKLRSILCLPLNAPPHIQGALYLDDRRRANAFSQADVSMLSAFGNQAAIALSNARLVHQLQSQASALEESRKQIEDLNSRLQQELSAQTDELERIKAQHRDTPLEDNGLHGMVGTSKAIRQVYRVIDRVSDKNVCVTILGESGTGKELVARAIHAASDKKGQFVSVNCGAVTEQLWESELFGHEKGSFTGAVRSKPGLFEIANNGTLFLDEVGDLPPGMQVKLLRVLQQQEFRRVGGTQILTSNARIICATNKDLEAMVRNNEFREDLWYRINVVELTLAPLRERRDDLVLLINHFLEVHGGTSVPELSRRAMAALLDHPWPGNIRELENEIQRALVLADGIIEPNDFSNKIQSKAANKPISRDFNGTGPLKEQVADFEKALIEKSLAQHENRVSVTAKALGLTRAGLYKKISKYDITVNK